MNSFFKIKKTFNYSLKIAGLIVLLVSIRYCGEKQSTQQTDSATGTSTATNLPILNPSFEKCGENVQATSWTSTVSATQCSAKRSTGTSFMPSQGYYFMELKADSCTSSIYQESVDLSKYSILKFDWKASGSLGSKMGVITILFTGNGTQTLWTKSFTSVGTIADEMLGESVSLPVLSSLGKLTIQADTTSSSSSSTVQLGQPSPEPTSSTLTFQIDNLRVCDASGSCVGSQDSGGNCN